MGLTFIVFLPPSINKFLISTSGTQSYQVLYEPRMLNFSDQATQCKGDLST